MKKVQEQKDVFIYIISCKIERPTSALFYLKGGKQIKRNRHIWEMLGKKFSLEETNIS